MAERGDITVEFAESPRLIFVAEPSAEVVLQDLHDTLRANTGIDYAESDLDNLDEPYLIDSAGKEALGGGVSVGITSTLQNAQLAFESRLTPTSTGTITTQDVNGTTLIDASGTLQTDAVTRGAVVINFTDQSITEVLAVTTEGQAQTRVLRAGSDNQFDIGDVYKIWNVEQCEISNGNLVAIDDLAAEIPPVFPTAFTQIVRTGSSSATISNLTTIESQVADIHGQVQRQVFYDPAALVDGPSGYQQAPFNTFTAAADYMQSNGIVEIVLKGNATLDRSMVGYVFRGVGTPRLTLNSQNTNKSEFFGIELAGAAQGTMRAKDCLLNDNLSNLDGDFLLCGLQGDITLGNSARVAMIDCYSDIGGLSRPSVTLSGGGINNVAIRGYRGGLDFGGAQAGDEITLSVAQGKLTLLASNTGGTISVRGTAQFTDNSAGSTVDVTALLEPDQLRDAWQLMGLDRNNPLVVTKTSQAAGNVDQVITGDGENTSIVTRQP